MNSGGKLSSVKLLFPLPFYGDTFHRDGYCLLWASKKENKEIVKLLLTLGVDVNFQDNTWVLGSDFDCHSGLGYSSLHYLVEQGNKELVELLVSHGADVNAVDYCRSAPLNFAVTRGDKEIIELLIAYGADVNNVAHRHYLARTPLNMAVSRGDKEIVKLLIAHGANLNNVGVPERFQYANSPLGAALGVKEIDKEIIELLITHGADVNLQYNGNTPLHQATRRRNKEVVELLITHGADVNAQDRRGDTPLDEAREHKELVKLLKKYGAK